ncbi:MAG: sugar phosphate isomerase/epimerase [Acidobacteria bacterium]|nr:sugar phosphate isomerase/epimerase [Acidobacteriota bacterium]
MNRRSFVAGAAAVAFPAILTAKDSSKRLPLAVSTLGCPKWDWKTIVKNASENGYSALELRGVLNQMDLPKVPELSGTQLAGTLRELDSMGLKVSDLGASAQMHEPDPKKHAAYMDEARRFIDLAHAMKVPYVRVFPNQLVKGEEKAVTMARIEKGLKELGDYAKPAKVTVIVESHGEFTNKDLLAPLMNVSKNVAFLWDTHHTIVAGEKPEVTWATLGKYTRHVHLKDSVPDGKGGRRYVLTGTGAIPVKETVALLQKNGYKGYYCYEWEKRWHPEIEDPEIAFPHFAKTMAGYLGAAK